MTEPHRFSIRLLAPLCAAVASLVLIIPPSHADERCPFVTGAESSLSPAERELIGLVDAAFKEYDAYYAKAEAISDPQDRAQFEERQDPAHQLVPKLLTFEKQHSATHAG